MAGISKCLSFVFTIAIGIAFAGCGGTQQITPGAFPQLQAGASRPLAHYAKSQPLLYVDDDYNNTVDIFPLTGPDKKKVGTISKGIGYAWGLSLDASNTLYVANSFGGETVTVYPYGSSSPSMTYHTKGMDWPMYALADSSGHVYVSGKEPAGHNRGHVYEYKAGNDVPIAKTLLGSEADGIAFDGKGNLYVAFRRTGPNCHIAEFGPGLTNKRILGMTIDQPQGLLVDSAGNIVVVESANLDIKVFPPGATTPSVTVTISGIGHLAQLAMQNSETTLWVSSEDGLVYSMPYPLTPSTIATEYDSVPNSSNGIAVSAH